MANGSTLKKTKAIAIGCRQIAIGIIEVGVHGKGLL